MSDHGGDSIEEFRQILRRVEGELDAYLNTVFIIAEFAPDLFDPIKRVAKEDEEVLPSLSSLRHEMAAKVASVNGFRNLIASKIAKSEPAAYAPLASSKEYVADVAPIAVIDFAYDNPVDAVTSVLQDLPLATFILYYSQDEFDHIEPTLHPDWVERFRHDHVLSKSPNADLKNGLRSVLDMARTTALHKRDEFQKP